VRLRWGVGPLVQRIGFGVLVGAGLSGVLLAMVSGSAGHLRPDPRIVLLMSEGDLTHILVTVLIACIAAPLIEETLFRGLLLESLRPRDTAVALIVSAMAFAVWHLTPAALVYYTAMGAVLGWLYLKRGLATSMAAHVGFNGVLTIAAIAVVLGPGHSVTLDGMSFQAPSGWSVQSSVTAESLGAGAVLRGPDDAVVEVIEGPVGERLDPDATASRLQTETVPFQTGMTLDRSSVREVSLPAGRAVEADVTLEGRSGSMVLFPAADRPIAIVFLDAGSTKATADFAKILDSLRVS